MARRSGAAKAPVEQPWVVPSARCARRCPGRRPSKAPELTGVPSGRQLAAVEVHRGTDLVVDPGGPGRGPWRAVLAAARADIRGGAQPQLQAARRRYRRHVCPMAPIPPAGVHPHRPVAGTAHPGQHLQAVAAPRYTCAWSRGMITIRGGLAVFLRPGSRVPGWLPFVGAGKLRTWKLAGGRSWPWMCTT